MIEVRDYSKAELSAILRTRNKQQIDNKLNNYDIEFFSTGSGNSFMGVFATRSPFRPNPLGLSCVKVDSIELSTPDGPVINVLGADLMDGTPIYDIKPYIRYADSRPEAVCGYVDALEERSLKVVFPSELSDRIADKTIIPSLMETLRLDPRPSYHNDPERVYGLSFSGYNVRFKVVKTVLTVTDIETLHLNGN